MKSSKQLLVLALLLAGCTPLQHVDSPEPEPEKRTPEKAGKTADGRQANSDQVWSELGCARRPLPYVVVEKSVLAPATVRAGGAMHYRLTYAACLPKSTPSLIGTLHTNVRMKEQVVQNHTERNYAIKAGRWTVDTMINVPESARSGLYQVELEFRNASASFTRSQQFRVGPATKKKKKQ